MKRNSLVLMVIAVLCASATANATGFFFQESMDPIFKTYNSGGGSTDVSSTILDFRTTVGLDVNNGFILGGTINYYDDKWSDSPSSTELNSVLFGPTIGYASGGFHFLASYLFGSNTYTVVSGGTTTVVNGTSGGGFQVDLGYGFMLSPDVRIGPSVVYQNMAFTNDTLTVNGSATFTNQAVNPKGTISGFTPMVTLVIDLGTGSSY